MSKLWGGQFDQNMYRGNIAGSIAHARMLAQCGIIEKQKEAIDYKAPY